MTISKKTVKVNAVLCVLILITSSTLSVNAFAGKENKKMLEQGKYIIQISGCNDCHTPGYPQKEGNIPVENWLTGNAVGFSGPWGVTYPKNLRILLSEMTEDEWVKKAHTLKSRPPMPWFALRDMSTNDLRAVYQFVRSLGVSGKPAPAYAPPGVAVKTPYIEFFPKNLPSQASAK